MLAHGDTLGAANELARSHGVHAYLYRRLRQDTSVPQTSLSALRRDFQGLGARDLATGADLDGLATRLDDAGVDWLLFKGPVLAETVYSEPDLRAFSDLDVLVHPEAFSEAIAALHTAGAELLDTGWAAIRREFRGQVHMRMPYGTLVDLHWHPLNRAVVRDGFAISTTDLFARRRTVRLRTRPVQTLGLTDTLLHLCVHCALAGGQRLLWLKDVDVFVRRSPIDWTDLQRTARTWGASLAVVAILARCRRLLHTPIPPEITAPSWVRAAESLCDVLPGGEKIRYQWTRTLREDVRGSAGALAALISERLREMTIAPVRRALVPPDQDRERRRYLAAVAGGDAATPQRPPAAG